MFDARSPTYSKFSFFLTNELNIRFRTRSAAESEAVDVSVSRVEKLSGRATVTYSLPVLRHEPAVRRTLARMRKQRFFSKTLPPSEISSSDR
jgi:hypothetical protein